jgi:NitT/TauT family transport system substrate-binding protein
MRAKFHLLLILLPIVFPSLVQGQATPPMIRAAYTSIAIQMTPLYLMKDLNLPRKYGLDVEMLYIPVSSRAIQAALAGEIQFMTSGGVANINANIAGADFVGLTATLNTFIFKILSQPEIKGIEALKGRKVGISRLGGASDFSIRYALDRWKIQPEKEVAIIQLGGEVELTAALQNKGIDAAIVSEPFATLLEQSGFRVLYDLSRLDVPYTLHGIGTRKSYIRTNRDTVIRFMKAYLEGIAIFKKNKDLALNTLKKYARLENVSVMRSIHDEYAQRLIRNVPYPSPEGIQTIIDQLAKTRPQAKTLNPDDFIDPTILREIDASGFVKQLYGQ